MAGVDQALHQGRFRARKYDPGRDREVVDRWFRRMFRDWKEQSGFQSSVQACCPERGATADWTLDRYLSKVQSLYILEHDGNPIGIMALERVPGKPGVIATHDYSIEPEYQGSGVGASIFRAALDEILAAGYRRIQVETWADNRKAAPIFKAMGCFWVPGTAILMENYLPMLYFHPEMERIRQRYGLNLDQWIRCHVSAALKQRGKSLREHAPDEYWYRGMQVFPYHFQFGADMVVCQIGVEAKELVAFTTPEVHAECYLLPGTHTLHVEVENRAGEPQPLRITMLKGATPETWRSRLADSEPVLTAHLAPGERFSRQFRLRSLSDTRHALATVITLGEAVFPFFAEF